MKALKATKSKKVLQTSVRIVERTVTSGADGLTIFQRLLKKNVVTKRTTESKLKAVVDAALISEFGDEIAQASYYPSMQQFIVNALMKEAGIKKQALSIAKKYSPVTKKVKA